MGQGKDFPLLAVLMTAIISDPFPGYHTRGMIYGSFRVTLSHATYRAHHCSVITFNMKTSVQYEVIGLFSWICSRPVS